MLGALLGLTLVGDLGRWPWLTLTLLVWAFAAFAFAALRLESTVKPASLLLVAAGLRLVLLPLGPSLSDDLLRYVWDGRVVVAGHNPYLLAPESEELADLRDERWRRMPHKEVPTVYPPLALGLFSIASLLPWPMIGLKILLAIVDLVACWLLVRLALALELPAGRAAWYAWNPLVCLEVAGMGHVDALVAAASVAAVLALLRAPRQPLAGAMLASAAVLAKIVPAIAVPLWARHGGRPWAFLGVVAAVLALAILPMVAPAGGAPPGLVTYGVSWEFNGPLYEPLWRLLERAEAAEAVKAGLDELKRRTGRHEFWNRFYPFVYPQLLAKLLLAGVFAGLWLGAWRARHAVTASGRVFGAFLLTSATLYPWYLLWVLPWAALCRHRAWLAASALVMISYLPQLTAVPLFPVVYLVIWLPFFFLLARSRWSLD